MGLEIVLLSLGVIEKPIGNLFFILGGVGSPGLYV